MAIQNPRSIKVDDKLHDDIMLFKIKTNAKNVSEVLRKALTLLKKERIKHGRLKKNETK